MFEKKIPNLWNSNWISCDKYTGESITSTSNFMNIRKIKKKPFGLVLRPGEIVLRKHGGKKISWHCPLLLSQKCRVNLCPLVKKG